MASERAISSISLLRSASLLRIPVPVGYNATRSNGFSSKCCSHLAGSKFLQNPKATQHVFQTEVICWEGLVRGSSLNTILGKLYCAAECGSKLS